MIVIRVELWSAKTHEKKTIGVAYIANDGKGTDKKGNYDIWFVKGKNKNVAPNGKNIVAYRILDFPRKRLNVWHLLYRGLKQYCEGK